jgi:cytosine/adenosine deaminase-related metal-dependent hydrolase
MMIRNARWHENERWIERPLRTGSNFFSQTIDASHCYVYPGLINAHDHLEMNLYWKLGSPPYHNYTQWANDVYRPDDPLIRRVQSVPLIDRLRWGALKNLMSGVTIVFHHNPYYRRYMWRLPVDVLRHYDWHHSLALAGPVRRKKRPRLLFIHAGEGIDDLAQNEVAALDRQELLDGQTVLIHAIALSDAMIGRVRATRTPIVWCPSSNDFLFSQTAPVRQLDSDRVALGTDSTMTGPPSLFEEMRAALKYDIAPETILKMVTINPSYMIGRSVLSLKRRPKSLILVRRQQNNYAANLIHSTTEDLECVIVRGRVRLAASGILSQLGLKPNLVFKGTPMWVDMDVQGLFQRLHEHLGDELSRHPLWQQLHSPQHEEQPVNV